MKFCSFANPNACCGLSLMRGVRFTGGRRYARRLKRKNILFCSLYVIILYILRPQMIFGLASLEIKSLYRSFIGARQLTVIYVKCESKIYQVPKSVKFKYLFRLVFRKKCFDFCLSRMFFCTIVMHLVYLLLITKSSLHCPSFLYQTIPAFHRYQVYCNCMLTLFIHLNVALHFLYLISTHWHQEGVNTRPATEYTWSNRINLKDSYLEEVVLS